MIKPGAYPCFWTLKCALLGYALALTYYKHSSLSSYHWSWQKYHVRYLSHLALQVGSSNWVHKIRIHSIQRWHHFGTKTSRSAFLLEKRLHPLLYWIWYSWSASTHILYYINFLSVRWNTLLRNQISSCQHVFYYKKFYKIGIKTKTFD
jgi:hypothetical protein